MLHLPVEVAPLSSNYMVIASWGQSHPKYDTAWDLSNEVETFLKSIEFMPVKLPERKWCKETES